MFLHVPCMAHKRPKVSYLSFVLAQAVITKYHRLGGLNNTHSLLTALEAGKSKIKLPADSVPGEDLFPSLQTAIALLCPGIDRVWEPSGFSCYKSTNPIMGSPAS